MSAEPWFRHRGHRINVHPETRACTYEDGTPLDAEERPCTACGQLATNRNAPDPCLGILAGVKAACCGHGHASAAYISFERGIIEGAAVAAHCLRLGIEIPELLVDDDPGLAEQLRIRTGAWITMVGHGLTATASACSAASESLRVAFTAMNRPSP